MDKHDHESPDFDPDFAAGLEAVFAEAGGLDPLKGRQGGWRDGRTEMTTHGNCIGVRHDLQNISHMHEAIMNWMIANPSRRLKECAAEFGVSRPWLSIIIHSDLFQARLREKQERIFSSIAESLQTKLGALADTTIEKLLDQIEVTADPDFLLETGKFATKALGMGVAPKAGGPGNPAVQQNFYVASQEDLVAARKQMQTQGPVPSLGEAEAVPVDATPNAEPAALPLSPYPEGE